MKKRCKQEVLERQDRDVEFTPRTKDIQVYLGSDLRKNINLINNVLRKTNMTISTKESKLIIAFFIELSLDNANRAGEIRHMTMPHFSKAVKHSDGSCTTSVNRLKTYLDYGKARLTVNSELMGLLHIYKSCIHSQFLNNQSPGNFFLTRNGMALSSMTISREWLLFGKTETAGKGRDPLDSESLQSQQYTRLTLK